MVVLNKMSRYHLAMEAVRHVPRFQQRADEFILFCEERLMNHKEYIKLHLDDLPEIRNWKFKGVRKSISV